MSGHAGNFPAFADGFLVSDYTLERGNLVTTPKYRLQVRDKLKRRNYSIHIYYKVLNYIFI